MTLWHFVNKPWFLVTTIFVSFWSSDIISLMISSPIHCFALMLLWHPALKVLLTLQWFQISWARRLWLWSSQQELTFIIKKVPHISNCCHFLPWKGLLQRAWLYFSLLCNQYKFTPNITFLQTRRSLYWPLALCIGAPDLCPVSASYQQRDGVQQCTICLVSYRVFFLTGTPLKS